jgi:LAO/AO transport system kinase
VQVVKTEAIRGDGIDKLLAAVAKHRRQIAQDGTLAKRRGDNLVNGVLGLAGARLRDALAAAVREDPATQELLTDVVTRRVDPASAARAIVASVATGELSLSDPHTETDPATVESAL